MESSNQTPVATRPARPFEDFAPGEAHRSGCRRMSRELIQRFADLSGDRNPIHLDAEFARRTVFRDNIAHGLLMASEAAGFAYELGLMGKNTLAFEEGHERYLAPLKPGDEYYGVVKVAATEPGASRRCGRIIWEVSLFKLRSDGPDLPVFLATWTSLVFKAEFLRE